MENASKALLIAGGVLVSILVVTLFIYMVASITNYNRSNKELAEIEDVAKFNERFTNYQRDDVQGYELLSLIHNVIDYNEQYTSDSISNKDSYNSVTLIIDMPDELREKLRYDEKLDDRYVLFSNSRYGEDDTTKKMLSGKFRGGSFQKQIEEKIDNAKKKLGIQGDDVAAKLAKNIKNIFLSEDEVKARADSKYDGKEESVYAEMANIFNQCTGNNISASDAKGKLDIKGKPSSNEYYVYTCMLYEYMQFKRAQFKCTELSYDDNTGRASTMKLEMIALK